MVGELHTAAARAVHITRGSQGTCMQIVTMNMQDQCHETGCTKEGAWWVMMCVGTKSATHIFPADSHHSVTPVSIHPPPPLTGDYNGPLHFP